MRAAAPTKSNSRRLTPGPRTAQSRPMKRMASVRVATLSRNSPRTAEVTVEDPGLRTPRMDMHRC